MHGIDVAAFQHPNGAPINWAAVAAAGYKFAAVKATEGNYYVNPWATSDLAEAKAAGLYVAPYHFAIPNASGGAAQAQFAVEYSGYSAGPHMLPLMLDIEYDPYTSTDHANMCYGLSAARMTAWLTAFVTTARTLTGQYPVIYTTANWWDTCTGRSPGFGADPMWIAAYGFASPPLPAGWQDLDVLAVHQLGHGTGGATRAPPTSTTFSYSAVGRSTPAARLRCRGAVSVAGRLGERWPGRRSATRRPACRPACRSARAKRSPGPSPRRPAAAKAVTYRVTLSA